MASMNMGQGWYSTVRVIAALACVLAGARSGYGAVTVLSPHGFATVNDLIYVGVPGTSICSYTDEVVRDQFHIQVTIITGTGRCVLGPPAGPSVQPVALGRLPAGTYTIDGFTRWDNDAPVYVGSTTVTVVAIVPLLQLPTVLLLIGAIGMFGVRMLHQSA